MTAVRILRLLIPTNHVATTALLLCFFNASLLFINSNFSLVFCPISNVDKEQHRQKRDLNSGGKSNSQSHHWKVKEENEYWSVEMAKYSSFNWEEEMDNLIKIIPALEYRSTNTNRDDADDLVYEGLNSPAQWGQNFSKSSILPLVTEKTSEERVADEVKKWNNKLKSGKSPEKGVIDHIWLCKEMEAIEKGRQFPFIKYSYKSMSGWKGELRLTATESILIKTKSREMLKSPPKSYSHKPNYMSVARNTRPYYDKGFERAKNEIVTLLKLQGWYGIPKLYGLCMMSSGGDDVIAALVNSKNDNKKRVAKKATIIRYIVSRHDDGIQLCTSYYASDECQALGPVLQLLAARKNSPLAALKVMYNTAVLFEQFWRNKAMLYDLQGTEFYISSNYDVTITDVSTVKFLPGNEYSQNSQFQRLLSGTICVTARQCPLVSWQASSISYKLGLHCLEIRGYCTTANRCWGVDSQAHACLLSRWFFGRMHSTIPVSWPRDGELTRLLQCASKQQPENRCTWKDLKDGLGDLLESAKKDFAI